MQPAERGEHRDEAVVLPQEEGGGAEAEEGDGSPTDARAGEKPQTHERGPVAQHPAGRQEVELQIECKDPKGSLTIEIWASSADPAQDKKVKSESASAAKSVKKKIKLDIPADAAGKNESHFYFVVKDGQGGEKKSDPIFVDRAPFKFSV